ncbi:hypothetical protein B0H15DRAFT_547903 [Mycena belliarum]|uniref:50S ribosomal protein L31, chloroplastic n=1 Tax=Mycena belliarum TaxID=1033014 RepID=A0AAD6UD02_9AGAR|nr:hypothetical protein B0H15DRAFT_547903 [Mycena belliae]
MFFSNLAAIRLLPSTTARGISSSPYGRAHVWKRRRPVLPNPVIPKFPQRVIRADGSSFIHWTTSPRSRITLSRDTTSHPLWNTGMWADGRGIEEENESTGRLGRFNRKFEDIGGAGKPVDWMEGVELLGPDAMDGELVTDASAIDKRKNAGGARKK